MVTRAAGGEGGGHVPEDLTRGAAHSDAAVDVHRQPPLLPRSDRESAGSGASRAEQVLLAPGRESHIPADRYPASRRCPLNIYRALARDVSDAGRRSSL